MNIRVSIAVIALLCILGVGGYYAVNSIKTEKIPSSTKEFTLHVVARKLVEGPDTLTVRQGDTVVIKITCDEAEELHLHGYNKMVDLEPNKEATLTFVADVGGHFPYELEHSKTDIGALDVLP